VVIAVVGPVAVITDSRVVRAMTGTGRAVRFDPATDKASMSVQLGPTTDHVAG
jgi:hypothetical protein